MHLFALRALRFRTRKFPINAQKSPIRSPLFHMHKFPQIPRNRAKVSSENVIFHVECIHRDISDLRGNIRMKIFVNHVRSNAFKLRTYAAIRWIYIYSRDRFHFIPLSTGFSPRRVIFVDNRSSCGKNLRSSSSSLWSILTGSLFETISAQRNGVLISYFGTIYFWDPISSRVEHCNFI